MYLGVKYNYEQIYPHHGKIEFIDNMYTNNAALNALRNVKNYYYALKIACEF